MLQFITTPAALPSAGLVLLLDIAPPTLLERLDDRTRDRVLLALAGLILLGALLVVITWLTFRMIRGRIRDHQRIVEKQRQRAIDNDDWAKKPLLPMTGEASDDT